MEFKEYATEVDVDFVRKAVRAIGRCAIKLERAAERCISVLLELIKIKVNYVVQEAIIVIKDIFRRYPNTYYIFPCLFFSSFGWGAGRGCTTKDCKLEFILYHIQSLFEVLNLCHFCSYESIIATLCENLDTLDEPEAKVCFFVSPYNFHLALACMLMFSSPFLRG